MSIYKINTNLSTSAKIEALNDMIIELNGKIAQAQFDKYELDELYSDLDSLYNRKYERDISLGHTLATYTGWSHVHAESGYSIWKYAPSTYTYNANNNLYFDDKEFENRGEGSGESITAFDAVYLYDGSYTNNTTEAGTEEGTEFDLMDATGEYLYIGSTSTFEGISFEFHTHGSNYTLDVEFHNGESSWTNLDLSATRYEEATNDFASDGRISWDAPTNWTLTIINGQELYWIRISTTTTPTTTAKAYLVAPSTSVIGLLKLSSEEFLNEEWAWCTYNNYIYVTIKNTGVSSYEGDAFITSSSTSTNKQNFFISNHEFKLDHRNTS